MSVPDSGICRRTSLLETGVGDVAYAGRMNAPTGALFVEIGNAPRDYAWGRVDGVAGVLGDLRHN